MHIAEGKKIVIQNMAVAIKKDIPVQYGNLVVVPNYDLEAGETGTARWTGLFDGPIKEGDAPMFVGEHAFFDAADKSFSKTAPADGVTIPVGVFIDGGVLLTGELIPPAEAPAE
ncbi:MAG: capsid cement protein [Vibrio sp.]|uniref:capsid cement protein n=1 Tax=Vibrio sp. TaxID=678 RepID=UPI003A83C7DC